MDVQKLLKWIGDLPIHDAAEIALKVGKILTCGDYIHVCATFSYGGVAWLAERSADYLLVRADTDKEHLRAVLVANGQFFVFAEGSDQSPVWKTLQPSPAWATMPLSEVEEARKKYLEGIALRRWEAL